MTLMHPILALFLILLGFLGALMVSAVTVAYASWIPFVSFMVAISVAVYIRSKERQTFDRSVSRERREKALQEFTERVKREE